MRSTEQNARGFSLMELLVAMALGLIVLGGHHAAVQERDGCDAPGDAVVGDASERSRLAEPDSERCEHGRFRVCPRAAWRCLTAPDRRLHSSLLTPARPGWPTTPIRTNYMYGIIPGVGNGIEVGGPAYHRRGHRERVGRDHRGLCRLRLPAQSVHRHVSRRHEPEWRCW